MKCLDTSVLIYAADKSSSFHERAAELLEQVAAGKWSACVCQQSLWELVAVITDSRYVRQPMAPEAAHKLVDRLLRFPQPEILYSDDTILRRALKLMSRYPAQRVEFAEAHLAATMLAHGVKTLVTANSNDFTAIREIEIENPFEALFA